MKNIKAAKYPGWRTMTSAQRRNAKLDRIFDDAKARGDWPTSDRTSAPLGNWPAANTDTNHLEGINMPQTPHSDASDTMYTVTVKKVLVTYATAYVRAKTWAEACTDALSQGPSLVFEEPCQDGSLEVVEVVEG